jgi:hypothetical protein
MYDLNPEKEKTDEMNQFISGTDSVNIKNLVWALGKLEERITNLETVILSMQNETT